MCGFIGFYNKNGVGETEQNDAAAMSHAIRHRGPDLDRAYGDGRAHFAFRRLSIIDLEGGSQPFVSEDGRYFAVYNGEVYNYLELRDELISRGPSSAPARRSRRSSRSTPPTARRSSTACAGCSPSCSTTAKPAS